ncbi:portal protein [Caminibacter mediatlanticus TB-2]|uniref:Portal protein n=1 Tax=Caminibacter mediatlanticus TB-2 TaxID=391592 RepID=A0ABX5V7J9_9BACT|nr:NAD-binding protein [Caminibacter mediatlanticus]QCT94201.1 portal protein [Caminibacter mediatlanticus TB-2]
MDILIVGAGKVGYFLAKTLSKNHNVTIIDKNEKALEKITETIDVLCINKDVRNSSIFHLLEEEYDYLVNVTNIDEINIISDQLLKQKIKIKHSILRIKNTLYISSPLYKIVNARLIFPYTICAGAISQLMECPKANNIKQIPLTEFVLVSIYAKNPTLTTLINSEKINIIGIERDNKFIFYNENMEIKDNDLIYIFGDLNEIKKIASQIDTISPLSIQAVTIFGGNILGTTIAKNLSEMDIQVKIIEKDNTLAKEAAEFLNDEIEILNISYEDLEILSNTISNSDIVITAYFHDEENIIKSLIAKNIGIKKVITINNNFNYYKIMHSLKLSTIRGPKIATFYEVLEEIDSQMLIYERFFLGAQGKIFIKKIIKQQKITPPKEYAKVLLIRNNVIIEITKKIEVMPEDIIIEFNFSGNKTWIENL